MLDNPFSEGKFPNIQPKPPLAQLEAISSHSITCYLGEETDPHLSTTSFQVVVESHKVSPQPPFLQAKQPQVPQLLLIRLLLQTLHQLHCPSLDTLQHLNVSLVVRGPKLNTGFEVRPHQCRVRGHDHFPTPAGHAIPDTSQDAIGLLGHLGTLLAHIQAVIYQYPQVLFHQGAFQPLFPKPVALHGVAVAQVQDLALGLAERHTIGLGPSIQPVQVPLQSLPPLKQINTPAQLGVICKLTEGALDPFVQIIDKDVKQNWPQHRALGNTACDWPPAGVNSIHHHSLGPAIQPVLYPAKNTPIQAKSRQFLQENALAYEDAMEDNIKSLTKVKTNHIHCSPHPPSQSSYYGRFSGIQVCLPYDYSKQIPEQTKVCSPDAQGCDPAICLISFPQDPELYHLMGWRLNHFPGQPLPMLDNPFSEGKFPNIQSKPPLAQLEDISSCSITCYLGEETDSHLSTTSFQVAVESHKVSPQPPFLQAKQPQVPQLLLIRLLLQTLHQLHCPSLDRLQHLNIPLVVGGPKLNTGFEVQPHQCPVQGHDHFPSPAGHPIFDTSQDAIGLLGRLGTLLAHIQAAVNQHPQVLLCLAAFQPLFPKPVALHGVAVAQVQDLALGLAERHTTDLGPSIQPVQVPLQSLPPLKQINTPTQLGVICKLTEGALDPFVQIIDKDVKQNWPQHKSPGERRL
ncbi:hypothetical protein QYF61_010028 [Mycteria americana]|uniref:Uncharacterized protein n=1 Tax=Mycteria americana TaxID=33587 RepID=A0AAN7SDM7_MYCAM|nr:hypothetical protein QYF61_010028 [Mycteria americana]